MRCVLILVSWLMICGCAASEDSAPRPTADDETSPSPPTEEELIAGLRADVAITDVAVTEETDGRRDVMVRVEVMDIHTVRGVRLGFRVPSGVTVEPGPIEMTLPDHERDQLEQERRTPECAPGGDEVIYCRTFWQLRPFWVMQAHVTLALPAGQPPFELEMVVNHNTGFDESRFELADDLQPSNNTRTLTID